MLASNLVKSSSQIIITFIEDFYLCLSGMVLNIGFTSSSHLNHTDKSYKVSYDYSPITSMRTEALKINPCWVKITQQVIGKS